MNPETNEQENYIYLINNKVEKYDRVIKYTKQFIQDISLLNSNFDIEKFEIIKTDIYSKVVSEPYKDFVKMFVFNEIPELALE